MSKSCSGANSLVLALALAACSIEPSAAEKKAADDRAVAQVEAVQRQKPPPRAINPQPILFADIQKFNLFGAGCAFAPGGSIGAVLLTRNTAGFIKLSDGMIRFAADAGSAALPFDTRSHYVGKTMSLSLTRLGDEPADALRWRARLIVTDTFDQPVYQADGLVQCQA
jgi:hypothetical protein